MNAHPRDSRIVGYGSGLSVWVEFQRETQTRYPLGKSGPAIIQISERHKPDQWRIGGPNHSVRVPALLARPWL